MNSVENFERAINCLETYRSLTSKEPITVAVDSIDAQGVPDSRIYYLDAVDMTRDAILRKTIDVQIAILKHAKVMADGDPRFTTLSTFGFLSASLADAVLGNEGFR